jgi:transmembrane sensor
MPQDPSNSDIPAEPELWEALARFVAGESSADEAAALERWLAEEPARAELVRALDRSIRRVAFTPPSDLDVEAALRRVTVRAEEPVISIDAARERSQERAAARWRRTGRRVAAAAAIVVAAATLWQVMTETSDPAAPDIVLAARSLETGVGQRDSVLLPDGSRVLLGPGSRLSVAAGYGEPERVIVLSGLAHIDVTHDEASPFIVRAGAATIRDLGTTFTVQGDQGEDVRVVVTAGSVVLHAAATPELGVVLQAGDRGMVGADGQAFAERGAASDDDLAWTRGRLVFRDASLDQVSSELRRWHGVELRVADPSFAGRHLTATFEGESVRQVLDVIGIALGATIELRGDTAIVRALPADPPR